MPFSPPKGTNAPPKGDKFQRGQMPVAHAGGCVGATNLQSLVRSGRRSATNACAVRDAFTKYFYVDVEVVSWQDVQVTRASKLHLR